MAGRFIDASVMEVRYSISRNSKRRCGETIHEIGGEIISFQVWKKFYWNWAELRNEMRIICISDTHHRYFWPGGSSRLKVPEGDILINAGDISMMGTQDQIALYGLWLSEQPHKIRITVPGNHDWLFQKNEELARSLVPGIVLIDQALDYAGTIFYGSPWQPWFCDWAFNLPRGKQLAEKWDKIPTRTDVLITHGPPFGRQDLTKGYEEEPKHVGCVDLANKVDSIRPKLHVFGHIHYSYGMVECDGTKFVNASICNERYEHVNAPIVVDL